MSQDRLIDPAPAAGLRILMLLANPYNPDWRVMKEATTLAAAGHEVTILAWDRSGELPAEETRDEVRVARMRSRSNLKGPWSRVVTALQYWVATTKAAQRIPFDVVHCHDLPTLPIGVFLKWRRHVPLVYDAHEMYWLMLKDTQPTAFVWVLRMVERLLMRSADRVLTVSEILAEYFRKYHRSVAVVGNWYDPIEADREAGLRLRRSVGITDDQVVLASIGSLGPERLYSLLIDYASSCPDVAVVIAGQGAGAAELEEADATIPSLHFLGWQSDPKPVYAAADILFYGLAKNANYTPVISPNTLFLSIAMCIPMAATSNAESGRIISQTGAGELLAEATPAALDSAVRKLADPGRRSEVKAILGGLQATYSWRKASQELLGLYDGLSPA